MDKFSYWTLRALSYIFLASAAASLILWIAEDKSALRSSWIIWISAILTSLFFAATSHVLSRLIERIFITTAQEETQYIQPTEEEYE